jgi:trimeric autotransporter adhesin
MKKIVFYLLLVTAAQFFIANLFSQSVAINTDGSVPNNSSILDIKSSSKGLLIPRMTSLQRNAIATPANGLLVFDISTNSPWFYNGTGWSNLAAAGWLLSGNSGTNPAANFIGTTDTQPLRLRVNNLWAGEISGNAGNVFLGMAAGQANTDGQANTALGIAALSHSIAADANVAVGDSSLFAQTGNATNVAVGTHALFSNITGNANTAIGPYSMFTNEAGEFNTAVGVNTLSNNILGNENVALGSRALQFNTADYNTATGASALRYNSGGFYNTANGFKALYTNTNGESNSATGYAALLSNSSGSSNTANGAAALRNNTDGSYNSAYGKSALVGNISGNFNTGIGVEALFRNSSGDGNTAIGTGALGNLTSGFNNIAIGKFSGTATTTPVTFNTISIGNDGWLNGFQNQVFIGNATSGWIGGWKPWSVYSDARLKKNIAEDVGGLLFIKKLRPVTYELRPEEELMLATGNSLPKNLVNKTPAEIPVRQTGFIAQEVAAAAQEAGYSFSGVSKVISGKELYSLSYESFVVPLVKAVQEQQLMIEALQNPVAAPKTSESIQTQQQQEIIIQLRQQLALLEKRLAALEEKK